MDKLSISDKPLKATCHCGAVTLTAPRKPKLINDCQCTICRRYAAAWAYYDIKEVDIVVKEGSSTRPYIWGDREISFNFCETCGCMCYWRPVASDQPEPAEGGSKMGINTRMVDPDELRFVNRRYSIEILFKPIGVKDAAHPDDKAEY